MPSVTPQSLISLADLSDKEIRSLCDFTCGPADKVSETLRGKVVALLFTVASTRTRSTFWRAALDFSANVMNFGPGELQISTGETFADTGRVLANVADLLVVRTNGPEANLRELALGHGCVVNAMSREEHPTQALADFAAIREHFGPDIPLRLSYFGEGNNTAAALALLFSAIPGTELRFYMPSLFSLEARILELAVARAQRCGAAIHVKHSVPDSPPPADVIYTTRWQTMGVSHSRSDWPRFFEPFRVDESLVACVATAKTVCMHDLPAVRGDEITGGVLEGPRSIVWRQAFHKLTAAKAVLAWCAGKAAA